MKSLELESQRQRLESLINRTPVATAGDFQLQAHWGRYLCVMVAGFLENALGAIYADYAYRTSSPAVANYASSELLKIQNPKAERFVRTAKAFNPTWATDLESFLAIDGRKEAIDGIMNLRHAIAHGRDAGIGVAQVKKYFEKAVAVLEFIESQCA